MPTQNVDQLLLELPLPATTREIDGLTIINYSEPVLKQGHFEDFADVCLDEHDWHSLNTRIAPQISDELSIAL